MLQAWNFVLVTPPSPDHPGNLHHPVGTIASVHSFTQSAIGPTLLGFLVLVLVGSFTLFAQRGICWPRRPGSRTWSPEGTFLANNLLLTVFVVVLIGTMFDHPRGGHGDPGRCEGPSSTGSPCPFRSCSCSWSASAR